MKIAFRADASLEIGTGHVMRCLTLAEALRNRGAKVVFVCSEHPGHLCDLINEKGFRVFRLGIEQESDARQSLNALASDFVWDWVIVDHYALDIRWESVMRKLTKNIMVIDDMADRQHDCDILLDQNLFEDISDRYSNLVGPNTVKFLGPRYALLRQEFSDHRPDRIRNVPDKRKRILVSFGGADMPNAAGRIMSALKNEIKHHIDIDVIAGMTNPNFKSLMEICKGSENIRLFRNVDHMALILAGTYLAVGGGGVSALERSALGVPSLIYAVAENQIRPSIQLSKMGAAIYMGKIEEMRKNLLIKNIEALIDNPESWLKMSQKAMDIVDAEGTSRIASYIMR